MFIRALFFFLLGITLALAVPSEYRTEDELRNQRSVTSDKVAEWWYKSEEKLKTFCNSIKITFSNLWAKLTGKTRSDEKQQKLIEIKEKYEQLQEESLKAVEAKRTEWDEVLTEKEQVLSELKQQANEDIDHEMEKWNERFSQLKEEANRIMISTDTD